MKKVLVFLHLSLFVFPVFGWSNFSDAKSTNALEEKVYISPGDLRFCNHEMYIIYQNEWQQVDAIFSDEYGLFVIKMPSSGVWYCKKCTAFHSEDVPRH